MEAVLLFAVQCVCDDVMAARTGRSCLSIHSLILSFFIFMWGIFFPSLALLLPSLPPLSNVLLLVLFLSLSRSLSLSLSFSVPCECGELSFRHVVLNSRVVLLKPEDSHGCVVGPVSHHPRGERHCCLQRSTPFGKERHCCLQRSTPFWKERHCCLQRSTPFGKERHCCIQRSTPFGKERTHLQVVMFNSMHRSLPENFWES